MAELGDDPVPDKPVRDRCRICRHRLRDPVSQETGVWAGHGLPDVRLRALRREEDYLTAMLPVLEGFVKAEAAVHADHPDYRQEWRP